MISKQLLELLACPVCHEKLLAVPDRRGLLCERCRLVFPVRDGIPIMLMDQAQMFSAPEPEVPEQ